MEESDLKMKLLKELMGLMDSSVDNKMKMKKEPALEVTSIEAGGMPMDDMKSKLAGKGLMKDQMQGDPSAGDDMDEDSVEDEDDEDDMEDLNTGSDFSRRIMEAMKKKKMGM